MKKETLIAIIMGLLLGAVGAFFLIFKAQEKKIENTKTISRGTNTVPTIAVKEIKSDIIPLEIKEPENNAIVDKNSIVIKGRAAKDSLIVIQTPIKEMVFKNDKEDFNATLPLTLGENTINITVYNKKIQAVPQEKEYKIYYLNDQ